MIVLTGRPGGHKLQQWMAGDGVRVFYREWSPENAAAAIVYLHGQGEHSGPFTAMGDLLAGRDLAVYAYDQRGFGLSREPRGHIPSFDHFVADAVGMARLAQERHPGRPVFLMGLSMGGHVALRAAARLAGRLAGVVVLSPGFKLYRTPLPLVLRTLWYGLVRPSRMLPTVVVHGTSTRNLQHLDRVLKDEYYVMEYSARYYIESLKSAIRARRDVQRIQAPVLMLQAGEDRVVCNRTARAYFQRVGSQDKEARLLPGVYHNMVVEEEMPRVAAQVSAWVEQRCRVGPGPSAAGTATSLRAGGHDLSLGG